jgi:hypothetical protein
MGDGWPIETQQGQVVGGSGDGVGVCFGCEPERGGGGGSHPLRRKHKMTPHPQHQKSTAPHVR